MPNILNIIYSNDPEHAAVVYLHKKLCTFLERDRGFSVTHIVLHGKSNGLNISDHDTVIYLDQDRKKLKGKTLLAKLSVSSVIKKALSGIEADLILCDGFGVLGLLAYIYRKQTAIPCILAVIHGLAVPRRSYETDVKRLLGLGKCSLVGVSQPVYKHLYNDFNKSSSIDFVNNGIDFDEVSKQLLSRQEARKYLGLYEGDYVVGSVGRLVPVKRHETMIEAVRVMNETDILPSNFKLIIFGDGPLYNNYKEKISDYGLDDYILLYGLLENAKKYLQALDLYIMASDSEGLSIAVLEAIAAKLPILLSDAESFVTMVPDQRYIFPVGNSLFLSEKIIQVIKGSRDYERLGMIDGVYRFARDHFCMDRFYNGYSKIIDKRLNS